MSENTATAALEESEQQNAFTEQDFSKVCHTQNLETWLHRIPADLPYADWFKIAAALKNEGYSFEVFDQWSRTAQKKYDEDAARRVWQNAGSEENPVTGGSIKWIADRYTFKIATPADMLPVPTTPEELMKQSAEFIKEIFCDGDYIELITKTVLDAKGKARPARGQGVAAYSELLKQLQNGDFFYGTPDGAWVTMNPSSKELTGQAVRDADITDFRYALVEADELAIEDQWHKLCELELPIKSVVWSGGKSLHVLVKIDAGTDRELYKKRVDFLYCFLEEKKFPVDPANKNPARLTRIPGFHRGNGTQYIVAKEFGPANWKAFESLNTTAPVVKDRRALTSAINGKLGGRPLTPITDIAKNFLEASEEKYHSLNGQWFRFKDNRWKRFSTSDMSITITKSLQNNHLDTAVKIGAQTLKDVLVNLEGQVGLVAADYKMPCWISSGADASDHLIFKNGILNLKEAVNNTQVPDLKPHTSDLFSTKLLPYDFNPAAECPMWIN